VTRALFACLLALAAHPALAADSYDSCKGTIGSLPATISTQGVWCLKSDLATSIASGQAITIATNNVTLDCNGFKLGGLVAGPETRTTGVLASNQSNVTIRNCSIRGFLYGITLSNGSGHVVANNRFDANTATAIRVTLADAVDVRGNFVANTGGSFNADNHEARGITVDLGQGALVRDNFISTVSPHTTLWPNASAIGISITSPDSVVEGNRVANIVSGAGGSSIGISANGAQTLIDNTVNGLVSGGSRTGLFCGSGTIVTRNTVRGAGEAFVNCPDDGGNVAR
jgi:parallel beta-helix repeat protein